MVEKVIQQCAYKIMKIACIANCLALSPAKFLPPGTLTLARVPCVTVVSELCGGRQHNLDFYGMWRIYDSEYRHTVYPETIQGRIFTSFGQPTRLITCANNGNI